MVWLFIALCALSIVAVITALVLIGTALEYSGYGWLYPILAFALAVVFGVVGGIGCYNAALKHDRGACARWGKTTAYEVKYENTGWGNWDCYANQNGKWLPKDQLRGLDN